MPPIVVAVGENVSDAAGRDPVEAGGRAFEVNGFRLRGYSKFCRDYELTVKGFSNPLIRAMIRLSAGAEDYGVLKNHIVDVARFANEVYHRDGTDRYMYRAPVLMLFHGNRWTMSYEENAHLVCHHSMLAAVALGLGTTIIGLVPPVVNRSKLLRERYGVPKDNKVLTSLILGYPRFKYRQSIRRDLAGVQYH